MTSRDDLKRIDGEAIYILTIFVSKVSIAIVANEDILVFGILLAHMYYNKWILGGNPSIQKG